MEAEGEVMYWTTQYMEMKEVVLCALFSLCRPTRTGQASCRDSLSFSVPHFLYQLNISLKAKILFKPSGSKCNVFAC